MFCLAKSMTTGCSAVQKTQQLSSSEKQCDPLRNIAQTELREYNFTAVSFLAYECPDKLYNTLTFDRN